MKLPVPPPPWLSLFERHAGQIPAILGHGIRAEVSGRPKHIYSIWRKMQKKQLAFEQLYDLRAVRVMVPDVATFSLTR